MLVIESPNAILAGLQQSEFDTLDVAAENIALERGALIAEAGEAAPFVYFPTCGVLSLVGTTISGATVELAVVGNEGVASVSAILGTNWLPFRVVTQVPGRAVRIPTDVVTALVNDCGHLHHRLLDYTHEMIGQVAQSAICNRFHNAKQRLARWLLMTADRAGTNELPLTHEFISYMVGGPRSAVTEAASELREAGALDYKRGLIVIRDGAKLRDLSCECYQVLHPEDEDAKTGRTGTDGDW
ncbi:MAG TPA: Crp/Fnr family transcriptional regulator [Vicinamibacterales bacterium]|nr:Crp/Fnr family transcriptional regulator [Vicinamibacterales bacterium]